MATLNITVDSEYYFGKQEIGGALKNRNHKQQRNYYFILI